MLTNYYTLLHLVREWNQTLVGSRIVDVFSQSRGELTIVVRDHDYGVRSHTLEDGIRSLKISLRDPLRFLFLSDGSGKPRKNVVAIFPTIHEKAISSISIADADRYITFEIETGERLLILPFGPRANVYLLDSNHHVVDRFRDRGTDIGSPAPDPEPSARIAGQKEDFLRPAPTIYWQGERAVRFSLVESRNDGPEGVDRIEPFDTVSKAVTIYARRKLAQAGFDRVYTPLVRQIEHHATRARRSHDRMATELASPSRADQYETWGHLLMARQRSVGRGSESIELDDIVSGAGVVRIPLDPLLGAVANAERYYARARRVRRAREEAIARVQVVASRIRELDDLLGELRLLRSASAVRAYKKKYANILRDLPDQRSADQTGPIFRTYHLDGGYSVLVGKSAAQNDSLTLQVARKFDLWLHARGVAGSHVVLRVLNRTTRPPASIIEQAASIAAYHSKARSHSLAPVIVTEKRYVRKPRKALPGTVAVEREEVLMVEPRLPPNAKARLS